VNLIGEHTDYNDGFVLPAAIGMSAWAAASSRTDPRIVVYSRNFDETREFDPGNLPANPQHHWDDYVAGVIIMLQRAGLDVRGTDLVISGDVPIGSGLSSSAALETVAAFALLATAGAPIDRTQIALLCQKAELEFVGVRVGIMDQFVSCHARAGQALLLDCRSLEHSFIAIPTGAALVICNSMVHHSLAGSEYNRRRAECEEGVQVLQRLLPGIHALRDVDSAALQRYGSALSPVVYRRCRHVIAENKRVLQAFAALQTEDLDAFGELMYESHDSLRDDYEVSCPELDLLVRTAAALPGVYGARMTGGGFGGCTINLVRKEHADEFRTRIADEYRQATGLIPAVYVTEAAGGAEEVRN
jgi:galactokinase